MTTAVKSSSIHFKATPDQRRSMEAHCERMHVSLSARILELMRLDILSHHHFDLAFEVGPTRRPRKVA